MTRTRLTAAERAEQMVDAAIIAFAATGYAGTTTDEVARLAGVSQPYVLRLFGSKQKLFMIAIEQACARIEQVFRQASLPSHGSADLADLTVAYRTLLAEPELLGILLHGFAASTDETIGALMRRRFGRIYDLIRELTGAPAEDVRTFLSHGILIAVLSSMRVIGPGAVPPQPWATELVDSFLIQHGLRESPSPPDE